MSYGLADIKEAANAASYNVDNPDAPSDEETFLGMSKESLQKKIERFLRSEAGLEDNTEVANRVVRRVAQMVWPSKALEVKRKRLEIEIEQRAMTEFLEEEIKAIMKALRG